MHLEKPSEYGPFCSSFEVFIKWPCTPISVCRAVKRLGWECEISITRRILSLMCTFWGTPATTNIVFAEPTALSQWLTWNCEIPWHSESWVRPSGYMGSNRKWRSMGLLWPNKFAGSRRQRPTLKVETHGTVINHIAISLAIKLWRPEVICSDCITYKN